MTALVQDHASVLSEAGTILIGALAVWTDVVAEQGSTHSSLCCRRLAHQCFGAYAAVPLRGLGILTRPQRAAVVPVAHAFSVDDVICSHVVSDEFWFLFVGQSDFLPVSILSKLLVVFPSVEHPVCSIPIAVLVGYEASVAAAEEATIVLVLQMRKHLNGVVFRMDLVSVLATDRAVVSHTLPAEIEVGIVELVIVELHSGELAGTQAACYRCRVLECQRRGRVPLCRCDVCVERRDTAASIVGVERSLSAVFSRIQLLQGGTLLEVESLLLRLELQSRTSVIWTTSIIK